MTTAQQPTSLIDDLRAIAADHRQRAVTLRDEAADRRLAGRKEAIRRSFAARFNLTVEDSALTPLPPQGREGPDFTAEGQKRGPGLRAQTPALEKGVRIEHTTVAAGPQRRWAGCGLGTDDAAGRGAGDGVRAVGEEAERMPPPDRWRVE